MSNSLTWSGKTSVGHSDEAYFGSLPGRSFSRGAPVWRVMFNDGSLRRPEVEEHPSLKAAQVCAGQCLSQPICERGYRSLANNALMIATRLCTPVDSYMDIEAAIAISHEEYPDARIGDIRLALAQRFGGASGFQGRA